MPICLQMYVRTPMGEWVHKPELSRDCLKDISKGSRSGEDRPRGAFCHEDWFRDPFLPSCSSQECDYISHCTDIKSL